MEYGEEMRYMFFYWLRDKGYLYEYCLEYMWQNYDKAWVDAVNIDQPFYYIENAFDWGKTQKGGMYWAEIQIEWYKYVHEEQDNIIRRINGKRDYIIEHNGVKYSEKTLRSILDKFAK